MEQAPIPQNVTTSSPRQSPLARPHWPWSTYSYRQTSSPLSTTGTPPSHGSFATNSSSGSSTTIPSTWTWNTMPRAASLQHSPMPPQPDDFTRQWNYTVSYTTHSFETALHASFRHSSGLFVTLGNSENLLRILAPCLWMTTLQRRTLSKY